MQRSSEQVVVTEVALYLHNAHRNPSSINLPYNSPALLFPSPSCGLPCMHFLFAPPQAERTWGLPFVLTTPTSVPALPKKVLWFYAESIIVVISNTTVRLIFRYPKNGCNHNKVKSDIHNLHHVQFYMDKNDENLVSVTAAHCFQPYWPAYIPLLKFSS